MKILITGAAGYIGSALCKELIENQGHEVIAFDNLSTGQYEMLHPAASFVKGDVRIYETILQAMRASKPDAVIHCAAYKSVPDSEKQPIEYYENNVVGTLNVLKAMHTCGVKTILFSSTAAVYDATKKSGIYDERDDTKPASVYGSTKLMCEKLITDFVRLEKIETGVCFRYFNLAGDSGLLFDDRNAQNVFPLLAKAAIKGETFKVFGNDYDTIDGTGVRDYIHIDDLLSAHVAALELAKKDIILNLGTKNGYSVLQLIEKFEEKTGKKLDVEIVEKRQGDVGVCLADAEKAEKLLNWEPKKTLDDMVESTLAVYS